MPPEEKRTVEILLWRHAEAEDGLDDLQRALTARGREQAQTMARWIRRHAPARPTVLVSPARRTRETADTLGLPFTIHEGLSPGGGPAELVRLCQQQAMQDGDENASTIIVVGHQPTLGQAAAWWMTGTASDWSIKKGGLWWLVLRGHNGSPDVRVKAVLDPSLAER